MPQGDGSWPFFEQAWSRLRELEAQLADPEVAADRQRFARLAKEHGALARKVRPYQEFRKVEADVAATEGLLAAEADPELQQAAREELTDLATRRDALVARLEEFLLAGDE